jgi:hypothetical protein
VAGGKKSQVNTMRSSKDDAGIRLRHGTRDEENSILSNDGIQPTSQTRRMIFTPDGEDIKW